jgi:flagellar assembly protein FliH
MSNVWRHGVAAETTRFTSFAVERGTPMFTPWTMAQMDADAEPLATEDFTIGDEAAVQDIDSLKADAFAQGFEAGRRTMEAEIAAERDAVARLAETLEVLQPQPTSALAVMLAEAVERLVRQIVGNVEIDRAFLMERAERAAAMIGEDTDPARLRVHPDDLPLLDPARLNVALLPDPTLMRGTLLLETGEGWIEDGPAVRLERLRAALDKMGAEE